MNGKNAYNGRMAPSQTIQQRYAGLVGGPALIDRSNRALIEVTGRDRVAWAHNLTSNQVKTLGRDEGNYAFVLNAQGRILFDLNLVVRAESIWLDLDRRFLGAALKHFEKYIIMEDVRVANRSEVFARFAIAGEKVKGVLADLGAANAAAMPLISMTTVPFGQTALDILRSDFCGVFAAELFVPAALAASLKSELTNRHGLIQIDDQVVQIRRIEAGIPWPGAELTDEVLPAETRQMERAVSFQKGCYLGQEIVERMRARKVVAKVLCGLRIDGDAIPLPGGELIADGGAVVGKLTSACLSVALSAVIGLGYVKSGSAIRNTQLQVRLGDKTVGATVTELPFVTRA